LTLLAVVGINCLEILLPKLIQLYIDSIAGNPLLFLGLSMGLLSSPVGRSVAIPGMLLLLATTRWILTYHRSLCQTRLGQGALFDLRSRIFNTMQNLSFAYHDASHSGTLISNVVEDVNYTSAFFQQGFVQLIEAGAYILVSFAFLILVCPPAGLASFALFSLCCVAIYAYFKFGQAFFARTKRLFADTVQLFAENMEGYLVVKGFGCSEEQIEAYNRSADKLHAATFRERTVSALLNQALAIGTAFGIPLVIAVAVLAARRGLWDLTCGRLFLIFYLQSALVIRSRMLSRGLNVLMQFTITAKRLSNLFEADEYLDDTGTHTLPSLGPGAVEVEDVSFAYGDRTHSVSGISIYVAAGETIGIVGPTGAGKTTLALLMCRFYDPTSGEVLLDGRNIRDFPISDVRNQFSLVFQDSFLFSASLRDNIAYGTPEARYEEIVHAASVAEIHDFIMSLPDGYDSVVGERGVTLSGGQRQRISIARAVLRKPRFLILDACTSALDTETEKAVQDSLDALRETTTIIVIAHRLSSVARADRIYVMRDGRIVEHGAPHDLDTPGTAFSRVFESEITQPDSDS